jgi:hypothetical protein
MQPPVIDAFPIGTECDGTPVYAPAREAGAAAMASCILWVLDHPRQTLQALASASLAAGSLYLAYDAVRPARTPARRRR